MTEPDVTLSDFAVAAEGLLFLVLLVRRHGRPGGLRLAFMLFFASVSAASLCGGMVHGFFLDEETLAYMILWRTTLIVMGVTALSMWAIGAKLLFSPKITRWILVAASAQFALHCGVVLFWSQAFWVGIADNLPAICFMLLALGFTSRRQQQWRVSLAAAGPALILIAAPLQQLRVGIHPIYFSHNALYHLLQGIAILQLFLGAQWLVEAEEGLGRSQTLTTAQGDSHAHAP